MSDQPEHHHPTRRGTSCSLFTGFEQPQHDAGDGRLFDLVAPQL